MIRGAFLKRMAFAALATTFLDIPLPKDPLDMLEEGTFVSTVSDYDGALAYADMNRLVREVFMEQVLPAVRRDSLSELFRAPPSGSSVFKVGLR